MKKKVIIILVILVVCGGLLMTGYAFRFKFYEWQKERIVAKLPPAISRGQLKPAQNKPAAPTPLQPEVGPPALLRDGPLAEAPITLPIEINLAVPFTPQAPYAVWDEFHNDACEEASALMLARFWQNKPIAGPADVEAELQNIKTFEEKTFGFNQDTTAAETAKILTDYHQLTGVTVVYDFTLEDLKREILSGRPVIIPAAGRELHNPFYKQPGPVYHMLVIKGVTVDGKFITNDPGTKRGADFVYGQDTLYNAINDWDSDMHSLSGRKAMIIVH